MEEVLVTKENIKLSLISVKGLRGNGLLGWLAMPVSLFRAVIEAIKIIREYSPKLIIGFGGFASGPGGLAAFLTRTPLIIHEQNAIAGLTNKVLSRLANKVFQAFPKTFKPSTKLETVGNPVRQEILDLIKIEKQLKDSFNNEINSTNSPICILVMGGSRGALALNRELPKLFARLLKNNKLSICHQVGKGRIEETQAFYQQADLAMTEQIKLVEFIDDIASCFNQADIVIARAGASTVSEIAAVGVTAVFIPYPFAVDDHQTANANWLVKTDAALSFKESELNQELVFEQLDELVSSIEKRQDMASKARDIAYLNATQRIADFCDDYVSSHLQKDAA